MNRLTTLARIRAALASCMRINSYAFDNEHGLIFLKGEMIGTCVALDVTNALAPLGLDALVQMGLNGAADVRVSHKQATPAQPVALPASPLAGLIASRRLPLILFLLTALSVLITGGFEGSLENDTANFNIPNGLMFMASLMSILLAHEFGHWIVARVQGDKPSWPLFIPLGIFGTMGAVIIQREPFKNRRALLQMALAGPVLGFLVALPLFVMGILLSEIKPFTPTVNTVMLGDSILTQFVSLIRPVDAASGMDLFLHPIGMAGWIGLLLTGINLLPAGQLDGGHIAYAVLGLRARYVTWGVIAALAILALSGSTEWAIWSILLLMFGRVHPPVQDENTPLSTFHLVLAIIGITLLALTFVPQPLIPLN